MKFLYAHDLSRDLHVPDWSWLRLLAMNKRNWQIPSERDESCLPSVASGSDSWFSFCNSSVNASCDCICLLCDIKSRRRCFSFFSSCFSICWASSLAWRRDDRRMRLSTASTEVDDCSWVTACVAASQSTDSCALDCNVDFLIRGLKMKFKDWVLALTDLITLFSMFKRRLFAIVRSTCKKK